MNKEYIGLRLDKYIAQKESISRSRGVNLINNGYVLVNNKKLKPSYLVHENDNIDIQIPEAKSVKILPQNIPISIIYEDKDIIVINKARGMVVHPAPGHADGTLVNALLYHCKDIIGIGGEIRPGIVHRIDKDTTGLLVIAKNDLAMESLSNQIAARSAHRKYKAFVEGVVKEDGYIDAPIGRSSRDRKKMAIEPSGRAAQTIYRVEKQYKNNTLLDVSLNTGRTHQIRVHMAYILHPVVGDSQYGLKKQKFNLQGQLLHAYSLEFEHPSTFERVEFQAPLPEDFKHILKVCP